MKEKLISRVLKTAYEETPYFNNVINEIIDEDDEITSDLLYKLPIYDKQTIIKLGWENFVSIECYDSENCAINNGVRVEKTSGTTGGPMAILWRKDEYYSSTKAHWKFRYENFNITPSSRVCVSRKNIPGNGLYYIDKNKLIISIKMMNNETILEIVKAINDFQPEWFYMQSSILYILVYVASRKKLMFPKSIRYIEYIGEPVCGYYRNEIAKCIPAQTSDMYGCVETNGIAYECRYGKKHLLEENVRVDIIDLVGNVVEEGTPGFVCVTGLHNTAMPILRYRLNDLAYIKTQIRCKCGNASPVIELTAARLPEYLLFDDLSIYGKARIVYPVNSGLQLYEIGDCDILFNLRMNSLDAYDIVIRKGGSEVTDIMSMLHDILMAYRLPSIRFSVKSVEEIDFRMPVGIIRLR